MMKPLQGDLSPVVLSLHWQSTSMNIFTWKVSDSKKWEQNIITLASSLSVILKLAPKLCGVKNGMFFHFLPKTVSKEFPRMVSKNGFKKCFLPSWVSQNSSYQALSPLPALTAGFHAKGLRQLLHLGLGIAVVAAHLLVDLLRAREDIVERRNCIGKEIWREM